MSQPAADLVDLEANELSQDSSTTQHATKRSRHFIFTINNPEQCGLGPDILKLWDWLKLKFPTLTGASCQLECGAEGTLHYQGWFRVNSPITATGASNKFRSKGFVEPTRSIKSVSVYCSKRASRVAGPWWYGDATPSHSTQGESGLAQGKRSDLAAVAEALRGGATFAQVVQQHTTSAIRYPRGIQIVARILGKGQSRNWPTEVIVYYGPSGCGKSRSAREGLDMDSVYQYCHSGVKGRTPWWTGYFGQETVIIDEFKGQDQWDIEYFNQITDRYGMQVNTHDMGLVQLRVKKLIFTTNVNPLSWYSAITDPTLQAAFKRRLTTIFEWQTDKFVKI